MGGSVSSVRSHLKSAAPMVRPSFTMQYKWPLFSPFPHSNPVHGELIKTISESVGRAGQCAFLISSQGRPRNTNAEWQTLETDCKGLKPASATYWPRNLGQVCTFPVLQFSYLRSGNNPASLIGVAVRIERVNSHGVLRTLCSISIHISYYALFSSYSPIWKYFLH